LVAWLDGSDINGDGSAVTNNADISTWKDKSGKSNHATGSGAIVRTNAVNGLAVADLRGQTNMLFPLGSSVTSYSIFTVQYGKGPYDDWQRLLNGYVDIILLYGFYAGTSYWITGYINGGGLTANTPQVSLADQWSIATLVVRDDTKTSTSSLNGVLQDTRNWDTVKSLSTLQIGTWSNGQHWQGYAAEIIVYTGSVSDTERQKVEGYLAWKWGLQSMLPSTHPYKSSGPKDSLDPLENKCKPGQYYSTTLSTCVPCDIGSYATYHNIQSKCTPCPSGQTTIITGATSLLSCISKPSSQPSSQPSTQPTSVPAHFEPTSPSSKLFIHYLFVYSLLIGFIIV
jgi:hypothetical protein